MEYTLLNALILELKIYCGQYKFYGRSKFGQYDEGKNRAPFPVTVLFLTLWEICRNLEFLKKYKVKSF